MEELAELNAARTALRNIDAVCKQYVLGSITAEELANRVLTSVGEYTDPK